MLAEVLSWVLTYAFHSTVLLGAMWALSLIARRWLRPGVEEVLWKTLLLGALATTTVHALLDLPSIGRGLPLPRALDPAPVLYELSYLELAGPPVTVHEVQERSHGDLTLRTTRSRAEPLDLPVPLLRRAEGPRTIWPAILLGVLALGAAVGSLRLLGAASRLRRKLADRRDVIEDPTLEVFFSLCSRLGLSPRRRIRLRTSPHLRSPVALWWREVVIPERVIEGLPARQQEALLAHEIAHVLRRDPLWSAGLAVLEALLFFQPLVAVARRRIAAVVELQCDDFAARHMGTGIHLARCLGEVATWSSDTAGFSVAPGIADRGSEVVRRISRLLDAQREPEGDAGRGPLAVLVGVVLVGVGAGLLPDVARAERVDARLASHSSHPAPPMPGLRVTETTLDTGRAEVEVRAGDEAVRVQVRERDPRSLPSRTCGSRDRLETLTRCSTGSPREFEAIRRGEKRSRRAEQRAAAEARLDALRASRESREADRRAHEAYARAYPERASRPAPHGH